MTLFIIGFLLGSSCSLLGFFSGKFLYESREQGKEAHQTLKSARNAIFLQKSARGERSRTGKVISPWKRDRDKQFLSEIIGDTIEE